MGRRLMTEKLDVPVRRSMLSTQTGDDLQTWVSEAYVEALEALYLQAKTDASEVMMARHYLSQTRLACSVWREAAQKFRNLFPDEVVVDPVRAVEAFVEAIENFDEVERIADDLDRMRKDQERKTDEILLRFENLRDGTSVSIDEVPE
jgi:hypothetical protein